MKTTCFMRTDVLRWLTRTLALPLCLISATAGTMQFRGGEYVNIPGIRLDFAPFSVELWAKRNAVGGRYDAVFTGGSGRGANEHLFIGFRDTGTFTFAFFYNDLDTPSTYIDDRWHHYACTYSPAGSSGVRRIYVDGTLVASDNTGMYFGNDQQMIIGGEGGTGNLFRGELDEVRIWQRELTSAEVSASFRRTLSGTEPQLAAYYRFDDGLGPIASDSSGNGRFGTLVNGPSWNPAFEATQVPFAIPTPATFVAPSNAILNAMIMTNGLPTTNRFQWGAGSTALGFDTANDQVVVAHAAALNAYPFSVSAWVKTTTDGSIVSKYVGSSYNGWSLHVFGGQLRAWYFRDVGNYVWDGGGQTGVNGPTVTDGQWHHVAFTVDGIGGKLYVDGALTATRGWTGSAGAASAVHPVRIGPNAQVDDVSVWNAALSASAISNVMTASVTNYANVVAHWKLDEGSGRVAVDSSPQGNHGTLLGDPSWLSGERPILANLTPPENVSGANSQLSLDGNNDYVAVPEDVWFNGNFTIEGRVYLRSYNNWSRLIDFGNGPYYSSVYFALSGGTDGYPRMGVFNWTQNDNPIVTSSQQLPLNQWVHLAATLNGTTATIYINGVAVGTANMPNAPINLTRTRNFIGRSNWDPDAYANALFDDVRIWGVALPPEVIRQWMNGPVGQTHPNYASLRGNWKFDEPTGNAAIDTGPDGGYHGAAVLSNGAGRVAGNPVSSTVSNLVPGTVYYYRPIMENAAGVAKGPMERLVTPSLGNGGALQFDGIDDQVRVPNFTTAGVSTPIGAEITIEFWQKVNAAKQSSAFILLPEVTGSRLNAHVPWSDGVVYWDFGNYNAGGRLSYRPPTNIIGSWQHFAFVAKSGAGGFMRIYRNGALEQQGNSPPPFTPTLATLYIGGGNVDGQIDEFRIWNVARSEAQIAQNFNASVATSDPSLVLYYKMDEGAGGTVVDSSPRRVNGYLANGALRVASTAPVGLPVPTTLAATSVAEGSASLRGSVKGDGTLPTSYWFEHGSETVAVPNSAENVVSYYSIPTIFFFNYYLGAINFDSTPLLVQSFTNIEVNAFGGPFWLGGPTDYFAARYVGRLYIPETGYYNFYTASDDGSALYIDGQLVVNNDNVHALAEASGSIFLQAGYHQLDVRVFEQGGDAILRVYYSGPGLPKQIVPASAFLRNDPVYSQRTPTQTLPINPTAESVTALATNLIANTNHHFRLVASNANGTVFGADQFFTMPHPGPLMALNLDGVNDHVVATPNAQTPANVLTLEAWVRPEKGCGTVVARGDGGNGSFTDYILAVGCPEFKINFFGGNAWDSSASAIPANVWTHIAVTFDGTNKVFYINGVPDAVVPRAGPLFRSAANEPLYIGRQGRNCYCNFFGGALDEIRVWHTVRTAADIAGSYQRNLFGNEPGLLAYYRFDEAGSTTIVDSGPNGYNGTFYNGTVVANPVIVSSGARIRQPRATTLPATPVLATTATLRGLVNPGGLDTLAYFEYGPSIAYGNTTTPEPMGDGLATRPFSAVLPNLDPGTAYYYRMVAYHTLATNFGANRTFTTLVIGSGWPVSTKVTGGSSSSPKHALDGAGNTYVAGLFSGSATFKSTLLPQGGSGTNAFVGKLARGADWLWATNIAAGNNSWTKINAIAVDAAQNVYVGGQFSGTNNFGISVLVANGETNLFVARLSSAGDWLWARAVGGVGVDGVNALVIGTNGNVYVAGQFSGTADFGLSNVVASGASDAFVAKIDPNGNWLWVQRAGGAGADAANGLVADSADNIFVTGEFGGTLNPFTLTSAGGTDIFVAKLNSTGTWLLARRAGSAGADIAAGLTIDSGNQIYLLGRFAASADYNGTLLNLNSPNTENIFLAKLNTEANVVWFNDRGGNGTPRAIANDPLGRIYISGDFTFNTQIGPTNLVSAGNTDVFLAQLDVTTGSWNWAQRIGATGNERAGSLTVDTSGGVVISGSYQNTIQIGYVLLTSPNDQDIFVARLDAERIYEHNTFNVGQPISVPAEAQNPARTDGGAFGQPNITILDRVYADSDAHNSFAWSVAEQKLFAVRPVTAVLKWPLTTDVTNTTRIATVVIRAIWPAQPQYHVATAPVDLEPAVAGFPYRYATIAFATSDSAAVDVGTKQFNASVPGFTVLQFFKTGGGLPNPNLHPLTFEVVRTVAWNDPAHLDDSVPAVIGNALTRPAHNDPTGKSGFVYFDRAFYDGAGNERAYNRPTRTGPILPVNEDTSLPDDDLVVVWYRTNQVTGIAWADDPVRYLAAWPANPDELVIASGSGSGLLSNLEFRSKRVYNQPDKTLPGYNPNEEHAALYGDVLYALRDDLNVIVGASKPYTLLKYRDAASSQWTMKVYRVLAENDTYHFQYPGEAGKELQAPQPLRLLTLCRESEAKSGPWFEDYNGRIYARAAGPDRSGTNIVIHWYYPLQPGFFYDLDHNGEPDAPISSCLPLLDRRPGGQPGEPTDITYNISWPTESPFLEIGDTLINEKFGLPGIKNFASASIVFDQANPLDTNALNSLVRLFDPLSERTLVTSNFALPGTISTANDRGRLVFVDLPYAIRTRLRYDPLNKWFSFGGIMDEDIKYGGPLNPLVLINVMTPRERDRIKELSGELTFRRVIDDLYNLTRNPNRLDVNRDGVMDTSLLIGLAYAYTTNANGVITTNIVHEQLGDRPKALTAGPGTGTGFVTIAENNDSRLAGLPVGLHVIRIQDGPFRGDIKVLYPDNVFDERLTLRHSADFGGEPQNLEFEWYYKPDEPDFDRTLLPEILPNGDVDNANGWIRMASVPSGINGYNDITIGDANFSSLLTLADNWFICRYRGYNIGGETNWSDWVGAIGGGEAQIAEGWVKRVVLGLNPFEARTKAFHEAETVTFASMLQQAGARYEGDIAFNPAADAINSVGLIAAYETVLRRARRLSIEGVPPVNFSPANNALLLAAGRIADFYMLLGNEAFADAADPTIGFRTDSAGYATLAPSIFAFQNQVDSLLEEELSLLRGRDNRSATVRAGPAYNRLFWNFTKDQGEVAYAQAYNITDQNGDGFITAEDARIMYPQGHGDAWGHYLTATKAYYSLLRNSYFDWIPRAETLLLAGVPVQVDYLDERKFARAAAAKAKAGAEIVDLSYHLSYVDDPAGQWQGYKDTDTNRAWGLSEWSHRAGTGAFLDWVTANALLPAVDPNSAHTGLTKIDRTTVLEIAEIAAGYDAVQVQMDKADAGLNPLGIAKNVVPFDIDPAQIDDGKTHFEQISERAVAAMKNAVTVFNHANQLSQALRELQDTVNNFSDNVDQQERDYKNRLIEVFGYPYAGDIGPGGTYPSGYDGPDLYHYMYVNTTELNGETARPSTSLAGFFTRLNGLAGDTGTHFFPGDWVNPGITTSNILVVNYPQTTAHYGFTALPAWGQRRAPGEIQKALSDLLQSESRLRQAQLNYKNLIASIDDQIDLLTAQHNLRTETIQVKRAARNDAIALAAAIAIAKTAQRGIEFYIDSSEDLTDATIEGFPKVVGLASDATAPARASIKFAHASVSAGWKIAASVLEGAIEAQFAAIDGINDQAALEIDTANYKYEVAQSLKAVEQLLREETLLRAEAFTVAEQMRQSIGAYQAVVAQGIRLIEERVNFRKTAAGETQLNRYQDMTFRVFRNDAIQKYRAQFDLAARYVFLAAVAYDYETQLLGGRAGAGRAFLTDIVRQRALGELVDGVPIAGRHGLADPLGRLNQNFEVLKGQLGFNNPQTETGRFSLRNEMMRLRDTSDDTWKAELKKAIVSDLWKVPEFRRYCRPFAPESAGPQPGLVVRFPTTVTFGLNYFGWPLGGGDNAYDPTLFATKVRSAGVWFSHYNGSGLSQTPRVYLVPVGADIMRSPSGNELETREWRIVDQKIPVPFPIGFSSLNNAAWIPVNDSLSDTFADIRRFSSFRAYHDSGFFDESQAVTDSRLIGRSVWNTDWMLIIPGGTFLFDPNQGLETFINSVSDIKIFFQTYSYSGN